MKPIDPPPKPVRGQKFWVQTGTHWSIGVSYSVSQVNGRSFYVSSHGRVARRLLCEWHQWLDERFAEGKPFLFFQPLIRPPGLFDPGAKPMTDVTIDLHARDQRFLRAAEDVLKNYTITRTDGPDGQATFRITGGTRAYTVIIEGDWSQLPQCDCPDAQQNRTRTGGFCKHVIATLLSNDALRYQLLDVIL